MCQRQRQPDDAVVVIATASQSDSGQLIRKPVRIKVRRER
jgi:hypothetical protein